MCANNGSKIKDTEAAAIFPPGGADVNSTTQEARWRSLHAEEVARNNFTPEPFHQEVIITPSNQEVKHSRLTLTLSLSLAHSFSGNSTTRGRHRRHNDSCHVEVDTGDGCSSCAVPVRGSPSRAFLPPSHHTLRPAEGTRGRSTTQAATWRLTEFHAASPPSPAALEKVTTGAENCLRTPA